mmetsp:Transcript_7166/g.17462  ORF Transcript_7166/g.17462 Transcript_7166/m.17462 type:complete len:386 (+) Transcript_7166:130-1287(+)|eukprot:CAMPEP_0197186550 /NCGR_PEP_ID=MMETSP1423-20130617/14155_1 /TAXON_ID=476441 /ORGANISM="Pseudo-nitzschia heimii, Strain UNC1101" /LENGTH=385 /DNA_ID=CAMNT_0042637901 /DNA_START=70 /DNA_END=1227 /DNA_ORIENTATION=+
MKKVIMSNPMFEAAQETASKMSQPIDRCRPHWARLPHDETEYSDWQIDVKFIGHSTTQERNKRIDKSEDGEKEECCHFIASSDDEVPSEVFSYLVHRYTIGPQSDYFNFLFGKSNFFSESIDRKSKFEFSADVGVNHQHFEDFLDLLYDKTTITPAGTKAVSELNTNKAIGMLYFADYFGIELVRAEATDFLRSRIDVQSNSPPSSCSVEELSKIYTMTESLSVEELSDAISKRCLDVPILFHNIWSQFQNVELQRELLHRLCRERAKSKPMAKSWSVQIGNLSVRYPGVFNKELFLKATNQEIMPDIETLNSALVLMKEERRLGLDERGTDELTCLQQRCTDKIYNRMSVVSRVTKYLTPKEVVKELRALKPAVMESFVLRMME